MNKVRILPSDVIAKIAAGEVIERPASVVKECVENSIDAGATSIEVHLKDAGKQLIHIKDNGSGITHDDLNNLFQRHATSKITAIDDLERLQSLGFRGEALFSIGSIADVVLKSKMKDVGNSTQDDRPSSVVLPRSDHKDHDAWQLHVRGGQRIDLQPAATSGHGTEIKISELFFNTPARKKFLKSNTTELNQIIETFLPYALLHPVVNFKLTNAERPIIDVKPVRSLKERAARALNVEAKHLLEVDENFKDDGINLRLVLGNINIQRTRRDLQYFFVNGRPIVHRNLGFHVNDIYRLILPPSIYGCFVIFIEVDPSTIDVNIHPAKREVKISQEGRLVSLLRQTIEYALMTHGDVRSLTATGETSFVNREASDKTSDTFHVSRFTNDNSVAYSPGQSQGTFNPAGFFDRTPTPPAGGEAVLKEIDAHLFQKPYETLRDKFGRAGYIGSFMNKYLLWELDDALLLVDQHAAQERIIFEKFKKQIDDGQVEVQHLLTPILLKLTPQEKIIWEESQEVLKEAGLDTNAFDEDTIAVQTVPVLIKRPEAMVRVLLSGDKAERCDHLTIARRACKASIVTGDQLSPEQARYQRQQLLECLDPFTCPHGRPTVIELKDSFLERQFLRS